MASRTVCQLVHSRSVSLGQPDIRRVALSDLGLKLHHSFNANTRHSNPGMDSHII